MTYHFLESLYADLLSIIRGLVIKRTDLARNNETVDSARAFAEYLACVNGTRYFYTFGTYNLDILERYMPHDEAVRCHERASDIPENLRDAIVADQAQYVLDTFEETNAYYRMLMGLPPIGDTHWIYIKDEPGIPSDVPIHQMTVEQISRLEIRGIMDKLYAEHPDLDYLHYLGINSIDLIEARLAKPFEILRYGTATNVYVIDMFQKEYHMARKYVMATIYRREQITTKDLYDPFIGILMLTLAIRNTMVPDEKTYLNFEEILDAILESYGLLKYFKNFPFTYKRRFVLAMDKLLQRKGTDGVLVDVCSLFSQEDLIVNRYYLMKTQPKDVNGNVIITGDTDTDYKFDFIRAPIESHDINTQEENRLDYYGVVDNDYLWQLTKDEELAIKELEFNLMMSKWVDVEVAYDVTSLVFETCCFINLLLYARDNLSRVVVNNVYAIGGKCSLFAQLCFLLAAMAQHANFDGNIVYSPIDIAEIWRFNYGEDVEATIREIVDKYELQIDVDRTVVEGFEMELAKPVGRMHPADAVSVYVHNRDLFDAILNEMHTTQDIRHYTALAKCKDVLFTSAMEMDTFTKSDGGHANTYAEMLEDVEPRLAAKLKSVEDEDTLNEIIVNTLTTLDELFNTDELKYLFMNTPSVYASLLGKYIRMAINVFKASSVQLRSINVHFKLGDRDPIRVIEGKDKHVNYELDDTIHVDDDVVVQRTIYLDEYIVVGDKVYTNMDLY